MATKGDKAERSDKPKSRKLDGLVLLKDLVPRADPKGGAAGKTVFGALPPEPETQEPRDPRETKSKRPRK